MCECVLRDSQSYLDHINGKYHNRALGMNMVVERSTADQVTMMKLHAMHLNRSGHGIHGSGRCWCVLQVRKKLDALKQQKEQQQPELDVADGACDVIVNHAVHLLGDIALARQSQSL